MRDPSLESVWRFCPWRWAGITHTTQSGAPETARRRGNDRAGKGPAHQTSRIKARNTLGSGRWEGVLTGEKVRPDVLRELRIAGFSGEAGLYTLRKNTDAGVRAVLCACHSAADRYCELPDGVAPVAAIGGDASFAGIVRSLAVGRSGIGAVRMDAGGSGAAGMGIFCVAQDSEEKDRTENQELG